MPRIIADLLSKSKSKVEVDSKSLIEAILVYIGFEKRDA
jgi:hypothetical protein